MEGREGASAEKILRDRVAPHALQDQFVRHDASGMVGEQRQHLIFLARQMHLRARAFDAQRHQVRPDGDGCGSTEARRHRASTARARGRRQRQSEREQQRCTLAHLVSPSAFGLRTS